MHETGLRAFETWADGFFQQHKDGIPGLGIIVRNAQGVLLQKTYGVQNRDTGEALRTDAIYPVASQSKTFTAVAVLKLAERGQINLDANITDYLPNLTHPDMEGVSVRDALAHNTRFSGFKDDYTGFWPLKDNMTTEELVAKEVTDDDFVDTPQYSNAMYAQLGILIENASGVPYRDFIQKEIIEKHGLKDVYATYDLVPDAIKSRIADGYNDYTADPALKTERHQDAGVGAPACGVYASAAGISDFYHKLFSGEMFSRAFTEQAKIFDRENGFHGLGITMVSGADPKLGEVDNPLHITGHDVGDILGHAGSQNGYSSETRYNPATGLTVSVVRTSCDEEHFAEMDQKMGPKKVIRAAYQTILDHPDPDASPTGSRADPQSHIT